jgi:hypothetical protein
MPRQQLSEMAEGDGSGDGRRKWQLQWPTVTEMAVAGKLNHDGVWAQATSFQAPKLIVNYFKIFFHFCEDCIIFREG